MTMIRPVMPDRRSDIRARHVRSSFEEIQSLQPTWGIDKTTHGTHKRRSRRKRGAAFGGKCYAPNGVETTGLTNTAKPWLEFNEQDWSFDEIVGPPTVPWAAYRQYRLKTDLSGPWYATVNG